MIEFYVTKKQLEKALEMLKEAENRGFNCSEAIFRVVQIKPNKLGLLQEKTEFKNEIILKAHSTDMKKDWGRVTKLELSWHQYDEKNGFTHA